MPASMAGVNAKRLVNPAKVVVGEPQRDGRPVVLPLLAERIRKPREAENAHARAEILIGHYLFAQGDARLLGVLFLVLFVRRVSLNIDVPGHDQMSAKPASCVMLAIPKVPKRDPRCPLPLRV